MLKNAILIQFIGAIHLVMLMACAPTSNFPSIDQGLAENEAHKQKLVVLKDHIAKQKKLLDVSYPILKENAPLCKDTIEPKRGFSIRTIDSVPNEWKAAYAAITHLGMTPQVMSVSKDSPADTVGIKVGDLITHVNGIPIAEGQRGVQQIARAIVEKWDTIRIQVKRDRKTRLFSVQSDSLCAYPVEM